MYSYPKAIVADTRIQSYIPGSVAVGVGSPRPDSRRMRSPIGGGSAVWSEIGEGLPGRGLSSPNLDYEMAQDNPLQASQLYFPEAEQASDMPEWWIPFLFGGKSGNKWRPPLPPFDGGIFPPLDRINLTEVTAKLPKGAIIMWHDAFNIPFGWVLCDYEHHEVPPNGIATVGHTINGVYVPNLEGRFIAMPCDDVDHLADWATNDTKETSALGDTAGYRIHGKVGANNINNHADHDISHEHEGGTTNESGHTHPLDVDEAVDNNGDGSTVNVVSATDTGPGQSHAHTFTTNPGGSAAVSHSESDNRPPTYYLLFIIKIRS